MSEQPKNNDPQRTQIRLPHFAYHKDELTLDNCIFQIRHMPDLLMEHQHGIILSFSGKDDDGQLIKATRKQWGNTADWLEYYLLPKGNELLPELTLTDKKHYKSFAELSLATRKLAKEISAYTSWQHQKYLLPDHWWLACEQELCEQALAMTGYIGKPEPIGCVENYKQTVQKSDYLDSQKVELAKVSISEMRPLQALEAFGYKIAKKDRKFQYWQEYKRTVKRCARTLRDSSLNPVFLIGGKIQKTSRGKDWRNNQSKL